MEQGLHTLRTISQLLLFWLSVTVDLVVAILFDQNICSLRRCFNVFDRIRMAFAAVFIAFYAYRLMKEGSRQEHRWFEKPAVS
ncbi:hypothetical protein Ccrd_025857 [Cynara cardunculus var. scolymus]|uniref:Uncharacterized protein n=1 Tax=Cynara cardunculus var. scolymus TaxID=59895 RepID=A0A103XDH7_CYNCS|nr:hypothetical protein Ccrd_025857 [Cynara cardunculus var. scolymus]